MWFEWGGQERVVSDCILSEELTLKQNVIGKKDYILNEELALKQNLV